MASFVSLTPFLLRTSLPGLPHHSRTNRRRLSVSPKCAVNPSDAPTKLAAGFQTITETPTPVSLAFTQPIPPYLADHTYYYTGPAVYEVPHRDNSTWRARHWFDGIGIVHAFCFDTSLNTVQYRSKLNNRSLVDTIRDTDSSNLVLPLVGSPSPSWLSRLRRLGPFTTNPSTGQMPYNNVVSLQPIPSKGVLNARTDVNVAQTLDPITLEMGQTFTFADFDPQLKGILSCAHGMYDRRTSEYFNFVIDISGVKADYTVFRIGENHTTDILATFKDYPCYIHSFALTSNHVIMILWPSRYNLFKLITTKSIADSIRFPPNTSAKFVVICRKQARVVATYEHDQFFSFHVVNAYEQDDDVHIDLAYYDDPGILRDLEVDNIIAGGNIAKARPVRFTLPDLSRAIAIGEGQRFTATKKLLAAIDIELATVAPRRESQQYSYMYGVSDNNRDEFHGGLAKLNVETGEVTRWSSPGMLTNEPVFATDPAGTDEDDGSLIFLALDVKSGRSSLIILNAKTMTETARAELPTFIPLGFHGTLLRAH